MENIPTLESRKRKDRPDGITQQLNYTSEEITYQGNQIILKWEDENIICSNVQSNQVTWKIPSSRHIISTSVGSQHLAIAAVDPSEHTVQVKVVNGKDGRSIETPMNLGTSSSSSSFGMKFIEHSKKEFLLCIANDKIRVAELKVSGRNEREKSTMNVILQAAVFHKIIIDECHLDFNEIENDGIPTLSYRHDAVWYRYIDEEWVPYWVEDSKGIMKGRIPFSAEQIFMGALKTRNIRAVCRAFINLVEEVGEQKRVGDLDDIVLRLIIGPGYKFNQRKEIGLHDDWIWQFILPSISRVEATRHLVKKYQRLLKDGSLSITEVSKENTEWARYLPRTELERV